MGWADFVIRQNLPDRATNVMVLASLLAVVCSGVEMLESEPLEQLFIIYFLLFKRQAFPCTALLNNPQVSMDIYTCCYEIPSVGVSGGCV